MIKSLRSLQEYQQLDHSVKRLSNLTVLNSVGDGNYDLDLVREEVAYAQELLTKTIREGTEQYKKWKDHSKLNVYTVVTYYNYDDDDFYYYCVEGDRSEDYRANNHRVIVTDRELPEVDHDSGSLDALCGEWMSRDLYNYIKLTLENYN